MRIALDTNLYSALSRGQIDSELLAQLEAAEALALPVPVLAELYYGFRSGSLGKKNFTDLNNFLSNETVHVLHTTIQTAEIYGDIRAFLKKIGKPIPANDLWIASLVAENGYTLCTADQHFKLIEGLPVIWN